MKFDLVKSKARNKHFEARCSANLSDQFLSAARPDLGKRSDKPEKKEKELDTMWVEKLSRSTGKVHQLLVEFL